MRRFLPVTETTTCYVCDIEVQPSPTDDSYSRQATVSEDDSDTSRTYCSNRCINADSAALELVWKAERAATCAKVGHRVHELKLEDLTGGTARTHVMCTRCDAGDLVVATDEQIAKAAALRTQSRSNYAEREASWERSDTDGFMSQWASGCMGALRETQAEILEHGGVSTFPALFALDGTPVPAKLIDTRFGLAWALLADGDDPRSRFVGFVNLSKARTAAAKNAYYAKKGYRVGTVLAPAKVELSGNTSPAPCVMRADGGYSRDAIRIDEDWYTDDED